MDSHLPGGKGLSQPGGTTNAITRRRFIRDTGVAVAGTTLLGTYGSGSAFARPERRRQTVAVFGGGVAGLTAAHELAERGFDVTLYESRAWGGKARSTVIPHTGKDGREPLPGEHSFRLEFGFYNNLPETMRRIPFEGNPNGVFDNLVGAPQLAFARTEKRDLFLPLGNVDPQRALTPQQLIDLIVGIALQMELPPDAAAYFGERMAVFMSSCQARRHDQWEKTTWTDFIGAARYPDDYYKLLGAVPQFTQASKPGTTAARFVGIAFEVLVFGLIGRGSNGPNFRVLDGPTNDAWIDPWLRELRRLGVDPRLGHEVHKLDLDGGKLAAAHVRTPGGHRKRVTADWYLLALPVERARRLWTRGILDADPHLRGMRRQHVSWINGVQFYLNTKPQIVDGLLLCADSPWAVSMIPQAQYWPGDFSDTYGDGRVHEKLSTIIADWTRPGIVYGKPARELPPKKVVRDLWEQIKLHINEPGQEPKLTDDMVVRTEIDPGMLRRHGRLVSKDPLPDPTAGLDPYRPDVATKIPNLFLCGDYLKSELILGTMETSSYNARRAINAIIGEAGVDQSPAAAIPPYEPPEFEPLKKIDEDRYQRGLPNLLDTEMSSRQRSELLGRA